MPPVSLMELAWLLFPDSCEGKLLLFGSYFDDAGTHDQAPVAALAGYTAPLEAWIKFNVEWADFLGRKQIRFYHSTDCCGKEGHGQFTGWDEQTRKDTHKEAVQIITRHPLIPIGAGITAQPFRTWYFASLTPGERTLYKPQYHYCFERIVYAVANEMIRQRKKGDAEAKAGIVLEYTEKVIGNVTDTFERLMTGPLYPYRSLFAGTPIQDQKEGRPELQAADVLAYEMAIDAHWYWHPDRKYGTRPPMRR
jgi:hypothetical protein